MIAAAEVEFQEDEVTAFDVALAKELQAAFGKHGFQHAVEEARGTAHLGSSPWRA